MSEHTALIVGAAPAAGGSAHYARLVHEAELLVAADGGLAVCLDAGRVPDVCVGDFDSTPEAMLLRATTAGAEIRRYPVAKDVSDLDLAVEVVREHGCKAVSLTAAFAGRIDHTLAALGTAIAAADIGGVCDEPLWTATPLRADARNDLLLAEPSGTVVSIIAPTGQARVTVEGFVYALEDALLDPLSSLGLSNVALAVEQRVRVNSGGVLVIVNRIDAAPVLQSALAEADTL